MAIRNPVVEMLGERTLRVTWSGLLNGDQGAPVDLPAFADRSVQVVGTFGSGGAVSMEGSNDGNNFSAVSDPRGSALVITTARIEQIEDCVYRTRPNITGGDGTTNLTVVLFARKAF